uniref:4a-hydroxytetrahydrobiopterin dehydratase n=1 Tax=Chloropicon laureae TaxID=464258 RepID=A0A7S3E200_9CHLO|mmetsp:Transcript_14479/g.37305  ORF Transcript_14479/g.37305 Transcript_14479/m.37305 type:complete len:230 (+) Transcript_14479:51-740(+)
MALNLGRAGQVCTRKAYGHICAAARGVSVSTAKVTPRALLLGERRHLVSTKAGNTDGMSLQDKVEGARNPYEGEIATNFTDTSLGNPDTEHIMKPPDAIKDLVGLSKKKCIPCEGKDVKPLTIEEADLLRKQCAGWKVVKGEDDKLRINCDWKFKNFVKSLEFFQRIAEVAEAEGHHPDLHLVGWNKVTVELWTHSVGGLTENDFILAAKINEIETSDLAPKKKQRFWA